MTEVNGTGYPPRRTPAEHDRRAQPVTLHPEPREPELRGDPEWLEVLRGLGVLTGLVGLLVLPCTVFALAEGSWPSPEPVKAVAAVAAGLFLLGFVAVWWGSWDRPDERRPPG